MRVLGARTGHLALLMSLGCSGSPGGGAPAGDERTFVPEGLPNTEAGAADGGLTLIAFTLVERDTGLDFFAAVRNEGDMTLCEAGMTTDFVDGNERLVGSAGMTLHSGRFFRIEDGSNAVITCIPPGEVAMGASLSLPESIVLDELAQLSHSFPSFIVPALAPVAGMTLRDVVAVENDDATAYAGTFHNALELDVTNPRVVVFPQNRAGRPLGMATSDAALTLPSGESIRFETSGVNDAGTKHAAFPGGSIVY